jgi:hypothetical protein
MENFSFDSGIWQWMLLAFKSLSFKEIFGLLLPFLSGLALINLIGNKLSKSIKTAVSMPLGFGIVGVVMFILLCLNIKTSYGIIITILGIFSLTVSIKPIKALLKNWKEFNFIPQFDFKNRIKRNSNIDLLFVSATFFVAYLLFGSIIKTLYWPVFDWDAITTFDFYGQSIYRESTLLPSSIKNNLLGSGVAYPPLTHLLIAYAYIIGFSTPKIIYALVLLSTAYGLYSLLRVNVQKAPSMLAVLLLLSVPEFISFASFVKTNSIQVLYSSIGFISFFHFYYHKEKSFLYLSIVMIMLNAWVRSEGIEFIAVLGLILFVMFLRKKTNLKQLLLFILITPILFLSWQVFLKLNAEYFAHFIQVEIIKYPFWDYEKLMLILKKTWILLNSKQYYAYTFEIVITVFVLNSLIFRKKANYLFFGTIVGLLLLHMLLLYQLEYKLNNMAWLLTHSYKRYIFNYLPLVYYFVFSSRLSIYLFGKYEWLIGIGNGKQTPQKLNNLGES